MNQDVALTFTCARCNACCRQPGEVRLDADEPEAMAAYLGIAVSVFTERYTDLREDRRGLRLKGPADRACIFLSAHPPGCAIHAVKPTQCRNFPLLWRYPDAERVCAALRCPPPADPRVPVGRRA
ncbi:MAG: YkgJ family cysteine cluster protein [Planctomycetota bacterium]